MKKKFKIITAAAAILIAASTSVGAVISIDTAARQYAEKSTQNALRSEITKENKLDDFRTDNKIKELNDKIAEYDKQYSELDDKLYLSGESTAKYYQNQMDEIALERYKLKYELAEYKYKQSENETYSTYSGKMNSNNLAKEAYEYFEKLTLYELDSEYADYTRKLIEYLNEKIQVIQTQLDAGYAMDIDVESAKAELSSAQAELLQYESNMEYIKNYLCTISGMSFQSFSEISISEPSRNTAEQAFKKNCVESEYKKSQMNNLTDYAAELEVLSFDIVNYAALSPYRLYPIDENILKELNTLSNELNSEAALQKSYISRLKLEIKQYETEITLYIDRLFGELEVYKAKLKAAEDKISVAEEQVRINTALLESGKIIPSEFTKSEVELKQLKAEKKSLELEVQKICYRLSNGIYQ